MVLIKMYRGAEFGSLEEAEKNGAVYETAIDDDAGLTSMFFRDTLDSVERAVSLAEQCIGATTDLIILLQRPDTKQWIPLQDFMEWSYENE